MVQLFGEIDVWIAWPFNHNTACNLLSSLSVLKLNFFPKTCHRNTWWWHMVNTEKPDRIRNSIFNLVRNLPNLPEIGNRYVLCAQFQDWELQPWCFFSFGTHSVESSRFRWKVFTKVKSVYKHKNNTFSCCNVNSIMCRNCLPTLKHKQSVYKHQKYLYLCNVNSIMCPNCLSTLGGSATVSFT